MISLGWNVAFHIHRWVDNLDTTGANDSIHKKAWSWLQWKSGNPGYSVEATFFLATKEVATWKQVPFYSLRNREMTSQTLQVQELNVPLVSI